MFRLALAVSGAQIKLAKNAEHGRKTVNQICMNFLPWRAL
jgi:hypothetical protein